MLVCVQRLPADDTSRQELTSFCQDSPGSNCLKRLPADDTSRQELNLILSGLIWVKLFAKVTSRRH